jgi:hypothetical protein
MDDLKLTEVRNKKWTIIDNVEVEFGLEKFASFLKSDKVHREEHIGNTIENEIKELESMKAYKYFGVEET